MFVRNIQFKNIDDVHALLEDLQSNGLVELVEDEKGNVEVKAVASELAEYLFMTTEGETYLVREMSVLVRDIQSLLRNLPISISLDIKKMLDKTPLFFGDLLAFLQDLPSSLREIPVLHRNIVPMLQSNLISEIEFLTKQNDSIPIAELRKSSVNPQDMFLNTPLAEALVSIRYVSGSQDCMKMAWPRSCQTSLFPVVFPSLTLDGYSYDCYQLIDWLKYCDNQQLPLQHSNPNYRAPSSILNEYVFNHALYHLIKLNVRLVEQRKLSYLQRLADGKSVRNPKRLNTTLKVLRKISNDYELSLLHTKVPLAKKYDSMLKIIRRNQQLLAQYPQFKDMNLAQLKQCYQNVKQSIETAAQTIFLGIGLGVLSTTIACFILLAAETWSPLLIAIGGIAAAAAIVSLGNFLWTHNNKVHSALEKLIKYCQYLSQHPNQVKKLMSAQERNQRCNNDLAIIDVSKQMVREKITDLRATAQSEIWDGVLCLIESGVDVNQNNLDGGILLSAVVAGRWDVATSLIENGLAINEQNKDSFYFALKLMITTKDWVKTDYLIRHGALHYAQNPDRKEIKTTLKEVGKWTDLSASHRLFKASDTRRVRGRNDHNINQPRMMN